MPGTYRFKWPHAAEEVFVTGTFDNWSKTIKLDKKEWAHEKTVEIPDTDEEILFKFVVNGEWRIDPSHAIKRDDEGNENNILHQEDIVPIAAGAATIATVAPGATTLGLAGAQPLEDNSVPGAFPETPMESEHAATLQAPLETGSVPTLQDQVVGVNPIPATAGIGNPIHLEPGEKVPDPSTLTDNTVASTVTTDKASYEAGANGAAYSPAGKVDDSAAHFGRPPAGTTIIPESSLPMGDSLTQTDVTDPTLNSVGPQASTVALAGEQPIQPRGTPTVEHHDDGIAAKVAAGAAVAGVTAAGAAVAANEFIKEKTGTDVVSNLPQSAQETIHENAKDSNTPAVESDSSAPTAEKVSDAPAVEEKEEGGILGKVAAGAAMAGVAAAGAAVAANEFIKEKTGTDVVSTLPQSAQDTIHQNAAESDLPAQASGADVEAASSVPKEVVESQKEANQPPEAAANETAVQEKSQAEEELLSKVPETNAQGEPAPTAAAAATAATTAAVATTAVAATAATATTPAATTTEPAPGVPQEVVESQKEANQPPEAAASETAVQEKSQVEKELLSKVPETNTQGEPAPTTTAATTTTVPTTKSETGAPQLGQPAAVGLAPISMDDKPSDANVAALKASSKAPQHPRVAAEASSTTPTSQKRLSLVDRIKSPAKSETGSSEPATPTSKKRQSFMKRVKEKLKNL